MVGYCGVGMCGDCNYGACGDCNAIDLVTVVLVCVVIVMPLV